MEIQHGGVGLLPFFPLFSLGPNGEGEAESRSFECGPNEVAVAEAFFVDDVEAECEERLEDVGTAGAEDVVARDAEGDGVVSKGRSGRLSKSGIIAPVRGIFGLDVKHGVEDASILLGVVERQAWRSTLDLRCIREMKHPPASQLLLSFLPSSPLVAFSP